MTFNHEKLISECKFKTSKSSGAGGQHVNKVETRVTILFDVKNSEVLNEEQKELILKQISSKLNKDGILQISSQKYKSQYKNKENVKLKLISLLEKSLKPKKKRKKTKISKAAKLKRLNNKKFVSELKKSRSKPKIILDN